MMEVFFKKKNHNKIYNDFGISTVIGDFFPLILLLHLLSLELYNYLLPLILQRCTTGQVFGEVTIELERYKALKIFCLA